MKLTVIGGGSTYTPELIYGFVCNENSPISRIELYDTDMGRLMVTGAYCRALAKRGKSGISVEMENSLESALSCADFVITQIRVGGNITRAKDEEFVRELGLVAQETTGAVGFMKAYRTIPVMAAIGDKIRQICPGAFLINFTNPAGLITTALMKHTQKQNLAGLCNVPIFIQKKVLSLLHTEGIIAENPDEIDLSRVELSWGGYNHFSWMFDIKLDGRSYIQDALKLIDSHRFDESRFFPVNKKFAKESGAIPSPYLRYFTDTEKVIGSQFDQPVRGRQVMELEKELLATYKIETETMGDVLPDLPRKLSERGGADYSRLAVHLINEIAKGGDGVHILNVPDRDGVFGPKEKFAELPVRPGKEGTAGAPLTSFEYLYPDVGRITGPIKNKLGQITEYEMLTVEAGLTRKRETAKEALTANPLVRDTKMAERILDYMEGISR